MSHDIVVPFPSTKVYHFRLYVAGESPASITAIKKLHKLCKTHLCGRCIVEVIDARISPDLVPNDVTGSVPTLIHELPVALHSLMDIFADCPDIIVKLNRAHEHSTGRGDAVASKSKPV